MNQRRSLPSFPMTKFLPLIFLALSACTAEVGDLAPADTSCAIDDSVKNVANVCLSDQFVVMHCGSAIADPGGIECMPPKGADGVTPPSGTTLSAVWCCR